MARPLKQGLDYFPLSTDFFDDDKILYIEGLYGFKAGYISIRLLAKIYRTNGYWYQWGETELSIFTRHLGVGFTASLVGDVVNSLIRSNFFDPEIFTELKILTSKGIQQRYMEAKRGTAVIRPEINLIQPQHEKNQNNISATKTQISATKTQISATPISSINKIKENKIKENDKVLPRALARAEAPLQNKIQKKDDSSIGLTSLVLSQWLKHYRKHYSTDYIPDYRSITTDTSVIADAMAHKMADFGYDPNDIKQARDFLDDMFETMRHAADEWQREHWNLHTVATQFNQLYNAITQTNNGKIPGTVISQEFVARQIAILSE